MPSLPQWLRSSSKRNIHHSTYAILLKEDKKSTGLESQISSDKVTLLFVCSNILLLRYTIEYVLLAPMLTQVIQAFTLVEGDLHNTIMILQLKVKLWSQPMKKFFNNYDATYVVNGKGNKKVEWHTRRQAGWHTGQTSQNVTQRSRDLRRTSCPKNSLLSGIREFSHQSKFATDSSRMKESRNRTVSQKIGRLTEILTYPSPNYPSSIVSFNFISIRACSEAKTRGACILRHFYILYNIPGNLISWHSEEPAWKSLVRKLSNLSQPSCILIL